MSDNIKSNSFKIIIGKIVAACFIFVFIFSAIVVLNLWLFERVFSEMMFFTNAISKNLDSSVAKVDKEQNKGFYVPADFPIIYPDEKWATLSIPSISLLNRPVFQGDNYVNLNKGIGHFSGSRYPGQNGKIVLSAHVGTDFRKLETMKNGDKVELKTIYGDYVYEVIKTIIFNDTEETVLYPEDGTEQLLAYTCYPAANPLGNKTQRFAIICKKISGKNWIQEGVKGYEK